MNKFCIALAVALASYSNSSADMVFVTRSVQVAPSIALDGNLGVNVNSGGVGIAGDPASSPANGSDENAFLFSVADTGANGTGATFDAVVNLTGVQGDGDTALFQQNGLILIGNGNNNLDTFTGTLGPIFQTSGSAASLSFVGFSEVIVDQFRMDQGDSFTIGGDPYSGSNNTNAAETLTITNPGPTLTDTGDDRFRLRSFTAKFNVTAATIPEPSSLALFGLGVMGLAARRRR